MKELLMVKKASPIVMMLMRMKMKMNVVQNQEAFDHSYTAQQGETNSAAHKNKETLLQNVRTQQGEKIFTANKVTKKTTKGATVSSKSAESGSLSWLGASELPVGTKVFLKSLIKHNRDVALATIISCDPKCKLDGAEIGNEYWVVHIDMALVKTENLVRSRKDCNTLDLLLMRQIGVWRVPSDPPLSLLLHVNPELREQLLGHMTPETGLGNSKVVVCDHC
ncbi:hypothetical protein D1007_00414 [Hordeum vulgare]|nr:hypothetical protein D1007_00414 [Hordeum vulgare]